MQKDEIFNELIEEWLNKKDIKSSDLTKMKENMEIINQEKKDKHMTKIDELLDKISKSSKKDKHIIISKEINKDILKDYVINNMNYDSINKIFDKLTLEDISIIFDETFTKKLLSCGKSVYIIFSSAIISSKNKEKLYDTILNNENIFKIFTKEFDKIYSIATELSDDQIFKLVKRIEKESLFDYYNYIYFNKEVSEKLINSNFKMSTKLWMLSRISKKSLEKIFSDENRAMEFINYIPKITTIFIEKEIKIPNYIIRNPKFFDSLKASSLVNMRQQINSIEKLCDIPEYLEEKFREYCEFLLNTYKKDTNLFSDYERILNDEEVDRYDFYLFNTYPNINVDLKENYKKDTSIKISEIIVEALFNDNIYNVWINIRELLSFNEKLDKKDKILSDEREEFYKFILDIDKKSSTDKISFYEKYKDTNQNFEFYEDIRNSKNMVYKIIKDKIVKLKNFESSKKVFDDTTVPVYDLRDKDFYMLVRTIGCEWENIKTIRSGDSYTIISNDNTEVFDESGYVYGYENYDIDEVEHLFENDSFSCSFDYNRNKLDNISSRPNRLSTIEDITEISGYSEIVLRNIKSQKKYISRQPDFIIAIDRITPKIILSAEELRIPIVLINKRIKNTKPKIFNENKDSYVNSSSKAMDREIQRYK